GHLLLEKMMRHCENIQSVPEGFQQFPPLSLILQTLLEHISPTDLLTLRFTSLGELFDSESSNYKVVSSSMEYGNTKCNQDCDDDDDDNSDICLPVRNSIVFGLLTSPTEKSWPTFTTLFLQDSSISVSCQFSKSTANKMMMMVNRWIWLTDVNVVYTSQKHGYLEIAAEPLLLDPPVTAPLPPLSSSSSSATMPSTSSSSPSSSAAAAALKRKFDVLCIQDAVFFQNNRSSFKVSHISTYGTVLALSEMAKGFHAGGVGVSGGCDVGVVVSGCCHVGDVIGIASGGCDVDVDGVGVVVSGGCDVGGVVSGGCDVGVVVSGCCHVGDVIGIGSGGCDVGVVVSGGCDVDGVGVVVSGGCDVGGVGVSGGCDVDGVGVVVSGGCDVGVGVVVSGGCDVGGVGVSGGCDVDGVGVVVSGGCDVGVGGVVSGGCDVGGVSGGCDVGGVGVVSGDCNVGVGVVVSGGCDVGGVGVIVSGGCDVDGVGVVASGGCDAGGVVVVVSGGCDVDGVGVVVSGGCDVGGVGVVASGGCDAGGVVVVVSGGCDAGGVGVVVSGGCDVGGVGVVVSGGCDVGGVGVIVSGGCNVGGVVVSGGCDVDGVGVIVSGGCNVGGVVVIVSGGCNVGGVVVGGGCDVGGVVVSGGCGVDVGGVGVIVSGGCGVGGVGVVVSGGCDVGGVGVVVSGGCDVDGVVISGGCGVGGVGVIVSGGCGVDVGGVGVVVSGGCGVGGVGVVVSGGCDVGGVGVVVSGGCDVGGVGVVVSGGCDVGGVGVIVSGGCDVGVGVVVSGGCDVGGVVVIVSGGCDGGVGVIVSGGCDVGGVGVVVSGDCDVGGVGVVVSGGCNVGGVVVSGGCDVGGVGVVVSGGCDVGGVGVVVSGVINEDFMFVVELAEDNHSIIILIKNRHLHWQRLVCVGESYVFTSLRPTTLLSGVDVPTAVYVPSNTSQLYPIKDCLLSVSNLKELSVTSVQSGDCAKPQSSEGNIDSDIVSFKGTITSCEANGVIILNGSVRVYLLYNLLFTKYQHFRIGTEVCIFNAHKIHCNQEDAMRLYCGPRSCINIVKFSANISTVLPSIRYGANVEAVTDFNLCPREADFVLSLEKQFLKICDALFKRFPNKYGFAWKRIVSHLMKRKPLRKSRRFVQEFIGPVTFPETPLSQDQTHEVPSFASLDFKQEFEGLARNILSDFASERKKSLSSWRFRKQTFTDKVLVGYLWFHPQTGRLCLTNQYHCINVVCQHWAFDSASHRNCCSSNCAIKTRDDAALHFPCPYVHTWCLGKLIAVDRFQLVLEIFRNNSSGTNTYAKNLSDSSHFRHVKYLQFSLEDAIILEKTPQMCLKFWKDISINRQKVQTKSSSVTMCTCQVYLMTSRESLITFQLNNESYLKFMSEGYFLGKPFKVPFHHLFQTKRSSTDPSSTSGYNDTSTAVHQLPVHQLPADQLPVHQLPADQLPVHQLPVHQLPADQLPVHQLPADQLPVHQLPVHQLPADQLPADQLPADQLPVDQLPADQLPADQLPADQLPADQLPADQLPVDQLPADQLPADQLPVHQLPADQLPADQLPADQLPADQLPVDQLPADQLPVHQLPADQTLSVSHRTNLTWLPHLLNSPTFRNSLTLKSQRYSVADILSPGFTDTVVSLSPVLLLMYFERDTSTKLPPPAAAAAAAAAASSANSDNNISDKLPSYSRFVNKEFSLSVKDLTSDVDINIYMNATNLSYVLGLLPGAVLQFTHLHRKISKKGFVYCQFVAISSVKVLALTASRHPQVESGCSLTENCVKSGTNAAGAVTQLYSTFSMVPDNLHKPQPFWAYVFSEGVLQLCINTKCTSCGSICHSSKCSNSNCSNTAYEVNVFAKLVLDDGSGQVYGMLWNDQVLCSLLSLSSIQWNDLISAIYCSTGNINIKPMEDSEYVSASIETFLKFLCVSPSVNRLWWMLMVSKPQARASSVAPRANQSIRKNMSVLRVCREPPFDVSSKMCL
ncbi:hypothetical protein Ahia01_000898600, partial [Argonauta hians]